MSKSDGQLKQDIETELRSGPKVNSAQIGVSVEQGAVPLLGAVDTYPRKWAAEDAPERVSGVRTVAQDLSVRYLAGVVDVDNAIRLEPGASASQVKEKIESALGRQAAQDTKSIHIDTSGGKVTLTGHASSWQSIEDAANAAWAAPGVTEVIDQVKMQMTS